MCCYFNFRVKFKRFFIFIILYDFTHLLHLLKIVFIILYDFTHLLHLLKIADQELALVFTLCRKFYDLLLLITNVR
jgi:hypothetical protein